MEKFSELLPIISEPASLGATDPVCGMTVDPKKCAAEVPYDGTTYFFCCSSCATKFRANPRTYLEGSKQELCDKSLESLEHFCPMHPEVRQKGPGTCPQCGMGLDPATLSAGSDDCSEQRELARRAILAAVISFPVVLTSMGEMLWSIGPWHNAIRWLGFCGSTYVLLGPGWLILERAWMSLRHRSPNMFTLVALGSLTAWLMSIVQLMTPGHSTGHFHDHFESVVMIVTLVLFGQWTEAVARRKTTASLRALLNQTPPTACRLSPGDLSEQLVPLESVRVGDLLRVRPGEAFPVDGALREGACSVEEAFMTGESIPVDKRPGDSVYAGTICRFGSVIVSATRIGDETAIAGVLRQIMAAQREKIPLQRIVDRVSAWFVPFVLFVSLATLLGWLVIQKSSVDTAVLHAVAVLVVACPCALGLAAPMAVTIAVGIAGRRGILIRDPKSLETMARISDVAFDKTGTLTNGKPEVVLVTPNDPEVISSNDLLALAASLEQHSGHPIAQGIVNFAKSQNVQLRAAIDIRETAGLGIEGVIDGDTIRVSRISSNDLPDGLRASLAEGQIAVEVARQDRVLGWISLADVLRSDAHNTVNTLRNHGLTLHLWSGDRVETATALARTLQPMEVLGGLSPEQKVAEVRQIRQTGRVLALIGDGVNDAPALGLADVSVAMGSGADAAKVVADVVLPSNDLVNVARFHRLAGAVLKNIAFGLVLAFGYNVVAILLATGVWPAASLSPGIAAGMMSLSSLAVVLNSLRLGLIDLDRL